MRAGRSALSNVEREVIEAAYFGHMTYREVAVALNLPEGTVKSRLNRGRAELARVLRKQHVTI